MTQADGACVFTLLWAAFLGVMLAWRLCFISKDLERKS